MDESMFSKNINYKFSNIYESNRCKINQNELYSQKTSKIISFYLIKLPEGSNIIVASGSSVYPTTLNSSTGSTYEEDV